MDLLQSLILGVIQGLTEFLPVSSSGHLVVFQKWLGVEQHSLAFDVAAHLGTLMAVITVYRKSLVAVLRGSASYLKTRKLTPAVWLFVVTFVGSLPTAFIGLAFKEQFESLFSNLTAVSIFLCITGVVLFFSDRYQVESEHSARVDLNDLKDTKMISLTKALLIGVAQGLAIAPGVSRSGSTIAVALFLGVKRQAAAQFSFALSVPAVLGAALLQLKDISEFSNEVLLSLGVGFVVSYMAGLAGLLGLLFLVQKGRLRYFSFYLWIFGGAVFLSTLFR
ncbi:MAG: undecaprenyl-diphosphate phosphatase [Bdellovibrionales bacterium]|nr:undecaprenyl-diphosphate phosphatase [Bdellovibrionales bacterium]